MRDDSTVENGGGCAADSIARARSAISERRFPLCRRAAMTEAQKRVDSLSSSSRESQATWYGDCAAHAESSVVFPEPAGAEHSSKRCSRMASRTLCNRSRRTCVEGGWGSVYFASSSSRSPRREDDPEDS